VAGVTSDPTMIPLDNAPASIAVFDVESTPIPLPLSGVLLLSALGAAALRLRRG
jgi:hypothetical protein